VRLLFFGIVRPYKGLDVLLRAVAGATAGVTLTVAGEFWGGVADTERLIEELGIGDRITLRPGYVPASEIAGLFAAADALVLPYREATASQNALLAFAHGVPVITTTAGSLGDGVRDGVDGITAAPGSVDDLLRALRSIAEPGTLARLRAGVRAPDHDQGWDTYLAALISAGGSALRGGLGAAGAAAADGQRGGGPDQVAYRHDYP
jgi:D-inositol-3-phosphate glycosyltransferase